MNTPPEVIEAVRKKLEHHKKEAQWLEQRVAEYELDLESARGELEDLQNKANTLEDWLDAQ